MMGFTFADPVPPDGERARCIAGAIVEAIDLMYGPETPVRSAAFREIAKIVSASGLSNGGRYTLYAALLADSTRTLRGELEEEIARATLARAAAEAVFTMLYRMLSVIDGVPDDIVAGELAALGAP